MSWFHIYILVTYKYKNGTIQQNKKSFVISFRRHCTYRIGFREKLMLRHSVKNSRHHVFNYLLTFARFAK